MQIRFHFISDPLSERQPAESLVEQFRLDWGSIGDSSPECDVSSDLQVTIRISLALHENAEECGALREASQSIELLSRLSSQFATRWMVGHEFEPNLGCISADNPSSRLIDEIEVTIGVARSLSGMIVDDEFVEPEAAAESHHLLDQEQSWDELLDLGDSFIRFPEFD